MNTDRSDPQAVPWEPVMTATSPEPHPLVVALERNRERAVEIRGLRGTGRPGVLRLYVGLDVSSYVEVSSDDVLHVEPAKDGEFGDLRAFVPASREILHVRKRRLAAREWAGGGLQPREPPQIPPPVRAEDFWTCAAGCEADFAANATGILIDEIRALELPDSAGRQAPAEIATRKRLAKETPLLCLNGCFARHGPPAFRFMLNSQGVWLPFSVAGWHQILVERHLERPEHGA
jgi:hypothetical protein